MKTPTIYFFDQLAIYLGKETDSPCHLIYLMDDGFTAPLTEDEFQRLVKPQL